ncbi:AMP-binding protein [Streptomyces sp. NPDC060184]|uniref:AMP-binding protein n=1 Tax=Streptomyces sp. NPDC060184 TaxID=3347064 RepID=UPI00365BA1D1
MITHHSAEFRAARDFLLAHREDYDTAYAGFRWPRPEHFNWALDWFDVIARDNDRPALRIAEEDGTHHSHSFAELSRRSDQVANWLRMHGVRAGDRVLVMLGNQKELWESALALMKLRAVLVPTTTLLNGVELADRLERAEVRHVLARAEDHATFAGPAGDRNLFAVAGDGEAVPDGWLDYRESSEAPADYLPDGPTRADDPLLHYFTSGTTSKPKLVRHTHVSYPVGHLTTMYWIGLRPGDVHLNISSPGWAKHAWSSLFAPWNAEATVFVQNYTRFDAGRLMTEMDRAGVTTFCAPPTVWRMLIQADLGQLRTPPREAVAAGEPLNPEVVDAVRRSWGVTVRDGFGQTETTVLVANTPGVPLVPGSMGRPSPGFAVSLLDPETGLPADSGEIAVRLDGAPVGLMAGYAGDAGRTAEIMADGHYRTGDLAERSPDGRLTYIGRSDDVFKSSDYKISPFELENALLSHEAVAEAGVVPAPDALRLSVPKAYVVLAEGWEPTADTAKHLFAHSRETLPPYKRVRRIEFAALPKTLSGKIRRTELRDAAERGDGLEYREEDFR